MGKRVSKLSSGKVLRVKRKYYIWSLWMEYVRKEIREL